MPVRSAFLCAVLVGCTAPAPAPVLTVTAPFPAAFQGETESLTAQRTSSANSKDVTQNATWTSSNPAVATISDVAGTKGVLDPIAPGTATITATDAAGTTATLDVTVSDPYQAVHDAVDATRLQTDLAEMTGYEPVTVGTSTYSITDRFTPASKAEYRAFWSQYFTSLGMTVTELPFPTAHHNGEDQGHDVEAVLPGKSKDSIVVVVHYDSMGPVGDETSNPGVDDDMTGMAMSLELGRILAALPESQRRYTVRFVAADYEEWSSPGLEGAVYYASYVQAQAAADGFVVVAAVDNEQSGWKCGSQRQCAGNAPGSTFDIFSCGPKGQYDYAALGDAFEASVAAYDGELATQRACVGAISDHYAMWEAGIPAVVFSEDNPFANPHFDYDGGDTLDQIDVPYFTSIATAAMTYEAQLVGITND